MGEALGRCPACGALMTGQLEGKLCPACLVALALEQDEEPTDEVAAGLPEHGYQLVSVLAREQGRATYLARRHDFHAFVSLEMIEPSVLAGVPPQIIQRRITAIRALCHPGIAPVLDVWAEATGQWCVVSPYVAGRPLASAAGDASLDVLHVFDEICEALSAAHAGGVAHGRLEPGSVVLLGTGTGVEPRLTGFTLTESPPTMAEDVTAAGRILVSLTDGRPLAARAAAIAARASSSVGALRAAAATLRHPLEHGR